MKPCVRLETYTNSFRLCILSAQLSLNASTFMGGGLLVSWSQLHTLTWVLNLNWHHTGRESKLLPSRLDSIPSVWPVPTLTVCVTSSYAPDLGPRFGQPNSWPICFPRILVSQAKVIPLLSSTSHWYTLASDRGLPSSKALTKKYSMYRHSKSGVITSCSIDQLDLPYTGTLGHGYVLRHMWYTSLSTSVVSEVHSKQTWWH